MNNYRLFFKDVQGAHLLRGIGCRDFTADNDEQAKEYVKKITNVPSAQLYKESSKTCWKLVPSRKK